jgi:hypothetical protein
VNVNLLVSGDQVDPLSGNAIQNGVPVTVCRAGERVAVNAAEMGAVEQA